jgi:hypothetical protein
MNYDVTEGLIGSRVDNCIGVVCDSWNMHDVCDEWGPACDRGCLRSALMEVWRVVEMHGVADWLPWLLVIVVVWAMLWMHAICA